MSQEFKTQMFRDSEIDSTHSSSTAATSLQMSLEQHINDGWEILQFHFNTTHATGGKHNTVLVVYSRETTAKVAAA